MLDTDVPPQTLQESDKHAPRYAFGLLDEVACSVNPGVSFCTRARVSANKTNALCRRTMQSRVHKTRKTNRGDIPLGRCSGCRIVCKRISCPMKSCRRLQSLLATPTGAGVVAVAEIREAFVVLVERPV